jgi:hypothetical protein
VSASGPAVSVASSRGGDPGDLSFGSLLSGSEASRVSLGVLSPFDASASSGSWMGRAAAEGLEESVVVGGDIDGDVDGAWQWAIDARDVVYGAIGVSYRIRGAVH